MFCYPDSLNSLNVPSTYSFFMFLACLKVLRAQGSPGTRPGSKSLLPALYKYPVYELRWSCSAQTPLSFFHISVSWQVCCVTPEWLMKT